MKKIVFFDVDGTLIDVSRGLAEPSELTKYSIKELINNGHLVFIATGRFKAIIPQAIKDLNPSGFVLSNGAYIEYEGKLLDHSPFDEKLFNKLVDYVIKNDCVLTCESQDYIYSPKLDSKLMSYLKKWNIEYVKTSDNREGATIYKCCSSFPDKKQAEDFENTFKDILDCRIQTADPNGLSYDINLFGINKGTAVESVINKLGIDKENTYCFCDGSNDIELAKACKYSYAMNNGDDNLKKIVYGVTDDVVNEGIYKKLVELGLIKEKK